MSEFLRTVQVVAGQLDTQGRQVLRDPHPLSLPVKPERQVEDYETKLAEYEQALVHYRLVEAGLRYYTADSVYIEHSNLLYPAERLAFDPRWLGGLRQVVWQANGFVQVRHLGKLK